MRLWVLGLLHRYGTNFVSTMTSGFGLEWKQPILAGYRISKVGNGQGGGFRRLNYYASVALSRKDFEGDRQLNQSTVHFQE